MSVFLRSSIRLLQEASEDGGGDRGNLFSNGTDPNVFDSSDILEASSSSDLEEFDPRVFWSVNAFLMFMLCSVCCWLCVMKPEFLTNMHERRQRADSQYQQTLRERIRREEARKLDSPEQRRRKLLQSFKRHKVQMVRTKLYGVTSRSA